MDNTIPRIFRRFPCGAGVVGDEGLKAVNFSLMRFVVVGFLLLLGASMAMAQPRGEVESIGLGGQVRLDCWTPMVVRLVPGSTAAGTYQLQVKQFDADGDRPVFTRQITLNAESQASQQRFWMYFVPEPIDGGLPGDGFGLKELQRRLKVILASADGAKPIAELPITSTVFAVDPLGGNMDQRRGNRLVLCVSDGASQPAWPEYIDRDGTEPGDVTGFSQGVRLVTIKPSDLPDNVLGYEAVDAIVWLNADPVDLQRAGENKLQTLRQFVRAGGTLFLCAGGHEWQRMLGFGDLLPVTPIGSTDKFDLFPLRKLAGSTDRRDDAWRKFRGPFSLVKVTANPGAVVDEWIEWSDDPANRSPYLVRKAYGMGAVNWVSQDLGDRSFTTNPATGWAYVWDRIFDWKNDTKVRGTFATDQEWANIRAPYDHPATVVDLGYSLQDVTLTSKSRVYVSIAVFFFIAYWVLAGPAGYITLLSRKKAHLSWILFCASAIVATLVTVLLVKLLLRGGPELKHLSLVKIAPNQPAEVFSRFGLYIPEDGVRTIQLKDTASDTVSALAADTLHPSYVQSPDYRPSVEYDIPIPDPNDTEPPVFRIPYRSTLKKFRTRWIGQLPLGLQGSVRIEPDGTRSGLSGKLINAGEVDLAEVYMAFEYKLRENRIDRVVYWPLLKKGQSIDLAKDLREALAVGNEGNLFGMPGQGKPLVGNIGQAGVSLGWDRYWFEAFGRNVDGHFDDSGNVQAYARSFPLLSFFGRLPVSRYTSDTGRFELLRRSGGRWFDTSALLSAGQLVVIARSTGGLPFPMMIEGSVVSGQGTTFYQFSMPLDRSLLDTANAPAPRPATMPTSTHANPGDSAGAPK